MILFYVDNRTGSISVLLEKRSDDKTWAIPGGGRNHHDRDLLQTAIRETLEETGIIVPFGNARPVRTYRLPFMTFAVFAAELGAPLLPRKNWESEDIRWFPVSSLPEGMNHMTVAEIRDFMKRRKAS